jgi:hypothetical protein
VRFSLDVIPARKGDCLILHYGSATQPRLMVIDGGPSNVYTPNLKRRLTALHRARRLDDDTALPVDVLLVSHIDDDHIKGVIDMTSELRTQMNDRQPRSVKVRTLWHNCFDDLLTTTPEQLRVQASFGAAAVNGEIDVTGVEDLDAAKVLASIPQGRILRDDAAFLHDAGDGWKVNGQFGGTLLLATDDSASVDLDGGLTCRVVGPLQRELQDLQKLHDTWLREQHITSAPETTLAAFVDRSVTNLSSIVLLVTMGTKHMLLTGDARGDRVVEGLRLTGVLPTSGGTLHVDLMKVPHHGSANNMAVSFFRTVTADHYVFSGNGEHGNPERETIAMLFEARGRAPFTAYFTYPIDAIDVEREKDWNKERNKQIAKGRPPRPEWSKEIHSLRAFFDAHPLAPGQQIVELPNTAGSHQVIDLLEPLAI